jgi:hypothetical protein
MVSLLHTHTHKHNTNTPTYTHTNTNTLTYTHTNTNSPKYTHTNVTAATTLLYFPLSAHHLWGTGGSSVEKPADIQTISTG